MVSERYRSVDAMVLIARHGEHLPPYKRTDPGEWSRKVQQAAFGVDVELVTQRECDEFIDHVRKIRGWLKDNGHDAGEHPDFCGTEHGIFWDEKEIVNEGGERNTISISVELHAWEQQGARGWEHYPKFTLDDGEGLTFSLNFDDTYELSIELPDSSRFHVDFLSRRAMTRHEYSVIDEAIVKSAKVFGISLADPEPEQLTSDSTVV